MMHPDQYIQPKYREQITDPTIADESSSLDELRQLIKITESLKVDGSELFAIEHRSKVNKWIEKYSSQMSYLNFTSIMRLLMYDGRLDNKRV